MMNAGWFLITPCLCLPTLFFIPTWAWDLDPGYGFKTECRATILLGSGFGRVPAWVMEKALGLYLD